ncbi:MAG: HNH endonuclease [Selenomonadales bacterium]|nr:HNH endonuclease [Selenomonadales bacterium]
MKSRRTKALDITKKVKDAVWERDKHQCILCGAHEAMPNAHYIARSQGGLGIEENIVTLCWDCHHRFDNTPERSAVKKIVRMYLMMKYPEWDEQKLTYKKEDYL